MKLSGIISGLRYAGAYSALSSALLACPSVHAETAAPAVIAFDIPAGSLQAALVAFASQSRLQLIYPPEAVAGRNVVAMRASLPVRVALQRLIEDTGLRIRQVDARVIVLEQTTAPAGARRKADLPPSERRSSSVSVAVVPGEAPGPKQTIVTEAGRASEEIVVTGTRIRGADSPSPRTVSTRKSLEDAGVTDMASFSRVLPQNFAGGQNPGVAGGGDQGGQSNLNNSTTLNLRGLGADATLTLINGHRLAYDALNQGIDISTIPLAAIERVEVVADGASALYGSDAVGGVANILLRRDYTGGQVTARYGGSTDGGNRQQQYTGVTGARWATGGLMVAADYSRGTAINASDRSYTRNLDGSQTLLSRQSQVSAIVSGHQALGEIVTLELDAQFANRRSTKATAFTVTSNALTNGLVNHPEVRSYAVTPVVRVKLPSDWEVSAEATRSVSRTAISSRRFTRGTQAPSRLIYENRLTNVEANAEGPLLHLPGGDARLALGGGYRNFALDINVSQTAAGVTRTTRDATEQRNSLFAYGELAVPIVGAENRSRLAYALHLSAAVRYERYEGIDQVATPKFGLVYAPHRDITLKGSWGRSFKIPTLNQVNQVQAGSLLLANLFSPQPDPSLPAGATVLLVGGGNPSLRAERATTWTATVELRPQLVPGLELTATYFDVDYRQRIASPVTSVLSALANPAFQNFIVFNPPAERVLTIIQGLPEGLSNQSGQPFDAGQVAAIIDTSLRNTARERARGVDLSAEYRIDTGAEGRVLLTAAASYLDADRQLSAGQTVVERAGVIFAPPHWRARGGISWEGANVQLSAFLNHAGSVIDDRFSAPASIGPFTTLDLSGRIRTSATTGLLRNIELRLSALNILNEKPDPIRTSDPAAIPFDSTNESSTGRFLSLAVTKTW